jgi:hypothetical protein
LSAVSSANGDDLPLNTGQRTPLVPSDCRRPKPRVRLHHRLNYVWWAVEVTFHCRAVEAGMRRDAAATARPGDVVAA